MIALFRGTERAANQMIRAGLQLSSGQ